jgi:UDP-N-acetylglucosamine:LPS N-acetylglucosamine transferase
MVESNAPNGLTPIDSDLAHIVDTTNVSSNNNLSSLETPIATTPSGKGYFGKDEAIGLKELTSEGLKVLFLSSDTGGGHRASAESLGRQFELLYPGSTYMLMDVVSNHAPFTSNLESRYKHLSAHPSQWKTLYNISNTRAVEFMFDMQNAVFCEKAVRKRIMEYNPDVVVSVHPMMTNLPTASCAKISAERKRHLPVFTVVTDLGSAHCLWFCNGVDKLFIASDQIRALAKERGKVPEEKIVQIGLPIRHDFGVQAELLGKRFSSEGKAYQQSIRRKLQFHTLISETALERNTLLLMGGGEGVGSLSNIVNALYVEFVSKGIDANIFVVCGRNEALQKDLQERDWAQIFAEYKFKKQNLTRSLSEFSFSYCGPNNNNNRTTENMSAVDYLSAGVSHVGGGCIEGGVADQIRKILSSSSLARENAISTLNNNDGDEDESPNDIHKAPLHQGDNRNIPQAQGTTNSIIPSIDSSAGEPTNNNFNVNSNDEPSENAHVSFQENAETEDDTDTGNVSVVGLGFVNNMAEYMVATDILVTKAGPGTIAEAASLSLPVLLTSFLPGQEEGNVDFVQNGNFGTFVPDTDPYGIAEEASTWLCDDAKLQALSEAAKDNGAPNAARDISAHIGELAMKWKRINATKDIIEAEEAALLGGTAHTTVNASGNTTLSDSPKDSTEK